MKMEREILKKAAAFFGVSFLAYLRKKQREISLCRFREEGVLSCVYFVKSLKAIHKKSRSTYGKRRIAVELQSEGISCGEHKAGTLLRLAGVMGLFAANTT